MNAHREISKNPERRCFVIFEVTGDALGCHPLPHFCNVERGYGWCYLLEVGDGAGDAFSGLFFGYALDSNFIK